MIKLSFCVIAVTALLATATAAYAIVPTASYSMPEPATGALVASGIAGWLIVRLRRK